ncbi:MAG TPA: hypothetical protein VGV39_26490 [Mesorhizobium sp.]|jgi:hypothetical protein|uniref:hypothetical protein n=1 Tax=Mesorhizobium sp. TaxID=1871066 RepID=UPI002DDD28B6|nr:hypothetical protein [Mesorhizobium sp.]HEV2506651.1 hypothetical protein [Mesorhizobium sp.]
MSGEIVHVAISCCSEVPTGTERTSTVASLQPQNQLTKCRCRGAAIGAGDTIFTSKEPAIDFDLSILPCLKAKKLGDLLILASLSLF